MATKTSAATEYIFKGGYPAAETIRKASDETDFQRAVAAYRFWYPTVSCEGIFNGNREAGASRRPDRMVWKDRKWEWVGLISDNGDFETPAGLDVEARDRDRGNGYRVITNTTNKLSHSTTRNCGSLYQVKFKRQIEGEKYGN
jgi:hypothetical protein